MRQDNKIIVLPRLDPSRERIEISVPYGSTLGQMVEASLAAAVDEDRRHARVWIGDWEIPVENWALVRPAPGRVVVIRVVPGSNQVLRNVMTIAVSVAAVALGQFYLGPALGSALGFASGGLAAGATSAVVTAGLLIASTLLINALVPLRREKKSAADSPTYTTQGWRNVANPDGVVPFVLGFHRMAPPYAALPFTVAYADISYVVAAFCFGYGPLEITDECIGDLSPIALYKGILKENRSGYPGDDPITLYPYQVIEAPLSVNLLFNLGVQRFTARDAWAFSVDIAFPQGLISYDRNGNPRTALVQISIAYRVAGSSDTFTIAGTPIYGDMRTKAKIATFGPIFFPQRGTYEVNVVRETIDDNINQAANAVQIQSRSDWVALRTYRPEYPFSFEKPVALSAISVQATDQLNGTLDTYNAMVKSICPDWDAATQTWITRTTNNPASLFRYVLTGPAISYPLDLDEVDLVSLQDWHEFCGDRGLTYNRIHDFESSILDVLSDIAAAGRASPHDNGTTWGVVIDRIIDTVSAHISPRNSWGFQGERGYPIIPDAFRVSFRDETNLYNPMERIVPRPDLVGEPEIIESIDMPGITSPSGVWREARRRWYEIKYRPDTYTVNQDFEAVSVARGDKVLLSHDVLDRVQIAARVKTVSGQVVTLDEQVTMDAALTYSVRFRLADGTSLLRTATTEAGTTETIQLTGSGTMPATGDLAFFGISGRESFEAIVKGIETMDNLTARLTLIDAAPEIQTLTDPDIGPAWFGRAGGELNTGTLSVPAAPTITAISSTLVSGGPSVSLDVVIAPGDDTFVDHYVVDHKLDGAGSVTTIIGAQYSSHITITGYSTGNTVDIQARAVNATGASANSALEVLTIGATYRFDRSDITWDSSSLTWDAA